MAFKSYRAEVDAKIRSACVDALGYMGEKAVELAQNLAAVDTGNMRSSITHDVDDLTMTYGTTNEKAPLKPVGYSVYVELGTRRMRAQPFIRPAVEGHGSEYKAILEDTLRSI